MGLEKIVDSKLQFYNEIKTGAKQYIEQELQEQGTSILKGFVDNLKSVEEFYKTYYSSHTERLVLCGINPGKLGAGKTGIPFLDFKSLSTILPHLNKHDSELSAQFIMSIISHFGTKEFFDKVYLTNISWFGFVKNGNNVNYYDLNEALQLESISGFLDEMEIVQPRFVVPLSEKVEKSLRQLMKIKSVKWRLAKRIPHPYYYSNFPTRTEEGKQRYIETIERYSR